MRISVALGVCALAFGLGGNAWAVPKPNYIIIIADDFGSDKMPAPFGWDTSGTPANLPSTPILTALGGTGLRFTNAWANPVCSPTRASLNTGDYAWRNDIGAPVTSTSTELGDVVTLATALAASPYYYQTALFGKWHLGETGYPDSVDWSTYGSKGPWAGGSAVYPSPMRRDPEGDDTIDYPGYGYFDGFFAASPDHDGLGVWPRVHLNPTEWRVDSWGLTGSSYPDQVFVDSAVTWIKAAVTSKATTGNPWMAVVALSAPHSMGAGGYAESDVLADDLNCHAIDVSTKAYYGKLHDASTTNASQAEIYQALVECMDERIGEFLSTVGGTSVNGKDGTIVVFMGDNGTPQGNGTTLAKLLMQAPYATPADPSAFVHDVGKDTTYQSGVRVPFIMTSFKKYMGGATGDFITNYGATVTAPVQTWDLYATMIDAAGGTDGAETDSISLYPCFAGTISTCAGTRFHYAETFDYDSSGDLEDGSEAAVGFVVSSSEYSMRAVYDETNACMTSELYKLTGTTGADPHQYTDLYGVAAYFSTCTTLRDKFATVDAAWMPRDGGDIYWCYCSCDPTIPCS